MTINEIGADCCVAAYHTIKAMKRNPAPSREQLEQHYTAFAKQHGWTISRFYFDEGKDHAGLDKLIESCKSGEIDLVICMDHIHFGRNAKELVRVAGELSGLE